MIRKRASHEEKGKGIASKQQKKKVRTGDSQLDTAIRVAEAEEVLEQRRTRRLSITWHRRACCRIGGDRGSHLDTLLVLALR